MECVKQLYTKLVELRTQFVGTPQADAFKKPHFHIVVLFGDGTESVRRQVYRGEQAKAHNEEVIESGVGEVVELRATDLDREAAISRYRTFKEKTYDALKDLREIFFYHFINAHGSIETVRARIDEELSYQASLELDEATYDQLAPIRVASSLSLHARQELVNRLDAYVEKQGALFAQVVDIVKHDFMPIVERHAISGIAVVNSENPVFHNPEALAMLIDIFSERGFHALVDLQRRDSGCNRRDTFKISPVKTHLSGTDSLSAVTDLRALSWERISLVGEFLILWATEKVLDPRTYRTLGLFLHTIMDVSFAALSVVLTLFLVSLLVLRICGFGTAARGDLCAGSFTRVFCQHPSITRHRTLWMVAVAFVRALCKPSIGLSFVV